MYKAIKTFAGIEIAMKKGDTREYIQKDIAEDLLRAGYIEEVKDKPIEKPVTVVEFKIEEAKEVEKPKKTSTRKKK